MSDSLEFRFPFEQVFDFDADFRLAAEDGPDFAFFHMFGAGGLSARRQRNVLHLFDQLGRLLQIEFDELFDLRFV